MIAASPSAVVHANGPPKRVIAIRDGRYVRMDAVAADVIEQVRGGRSFEEVASDLREAGWDVSPTWVAVMFRRLESRLAEIEATPVVDPPGYWLRIPLVPSAVVRAATRHVTWLFNPRAAIVLTAAVVVAYTVLWSKGGNWSPASIGVGPAIVLLVISGFVHEFGHATASARGGTRASSIGFVLYWIWPSLYCDVTKTWLLPRRERIIVDVGGVYVQMLCGALYAVAYSVTAWGPLRTAALLVVVTAAVCANPLWKMDGYWTLSDLLDIPNLSSWPTRLGRAVMQALVGKKADWPLHRLQTAVVALLGVSRLVMVGVVCAFIVAQLATTTGVVLHDVGRSGLTTGLHDSLLSGPVVNVAWRAAATLLMLFGLARTVQWVIGKGVSWVVKASIGARTRSANA